MKKNGSKSLFRKLTRCEWSMLLFLFLYGTPISGKKMVQNPGQKPRWTGRVSSSRMIRSSRLTSLRTMAEILRWRAQCGAIGNMGFVFTQKHMGISIVLRHLFLRFACSRKVYHPAWVFGYTHIQSLQSNITFRLDCG